MQASERRGDVAAWSMDPYTEQAYDETQQKKSTL